MTTKKIKPTRKKNKYIKVRLSPEEQKNVQEFCFQNDVTISDLVRKGISEFAPQIFEKL